MLSEQDMKLAKCTYTFWDKLTPEQQEFLWENLYPVSYHKGDSIHNGEYSCIGVVLIKTGGLRVFMLSSEGKEITLYRLGPQEVCVLSASCILQNITFDVCVEAEEDTEALLIPSAQYQKLIKQNIYAENFTYSLVIDRFSNVRWAMEQLLFMRFDDIIGNVFFALFRHNRKFFHILPLFQFKCLTKAVWHPPHNSSIGLLSSHVRLLLW